MVPRDAGPATRGAREVAQFIGATPDEVAFINNVSAGVSAVTQSLTLGPGDEVLSTNHIYGAVASALDRLCARTGPAAWWPPSPWRAATTMWSPSWTSTARNDTVLVAIDQVTSPTARRFPIEAVAKLAHRYGAAAMVDGAHAPGMLPLDVPKIGADFWVGNLHKWACAPVGSGALWVAPAWREKMLSLIVSWGEADGFPLSFERVGTDDLTAWMASPCSLNVLGSLGWDRVRAHNEALVCWAQSTVSEILGSPPGKLRHDAGMSMAVVPLPAGVADTREQCHAIQEHMVTRGVEMSIGCWDGHGGVRLSAHVYNRPADYERLATGIRDFIAT